MDVKRTSARVFRDNDGYQIAQYLLPHRSPANSIMLSIRSPDISTRFNRWQLLEEVMDDASCGRSYVAFAKDSLNLSEDYGECYR